MKENLDKELEERFNRYDELYKNGGNDPFWSDGVGLNLVRNHIIFLKRKIKEEYADKDYPEIYFRAVPDPVDNDYMAKSNEIRKKAEGLYRYLQELPCLAELKKANSLYDSEVLAQTGMTSALNRFQTLKNAIENNDLVVLRRYVQNKEMHEKIFEDAMNSLNDYRISVKKKKGQMSLFEMNI